jgi:hypothetical protein
MNNNAREAARTLELKVFDEGVPCKYGHIDGRRVSDGRCVGCGKSRSKAYNEENKRALADLRKERYGKNRKSLLSGMKDYRDKNKSTISRRMKRYYDENRSVILRQKKEYAERNREAIALYLKEYQERNKDSIVSYRKSYWSTNRDALLVRQREKYAQNAVTRRTASSRSRAARAKRIICWGKEADELTRLREVELHELCVRMEGDTGVKFHVDHMIPLQGSLVCGLHVWNNLQAIPRELNQSKKNKFILTEENDWTRIESDVSVMKEPSWYREAENFYKSSGWDFKRGCYVK